MIFGFYGEPPTVLPTVPLLSGLKNKRPLQGRPYTEDLGFATFDTTILHAFIFKSIFWSASQSDLKPLEDHCAHQTSSVVKGDRNNELDAWR